MPPVRFSDLDAKAQARVIERWPEARPDPDKHRQGKRIRLARRRPWHVWIMVALVGLAAYSLLALGWLLKELGSGLYSLAARMHDAKWSIE